MEEFHVYLLVDVLIFVSGVDLQGAWVLGLTGGNGAAFKAFDFQEVSDHEWWQVVDLVWDGDVFGLIDWEADAEVQEFYLIHIYHFFRWISI